MYNNRISRIFFAKSIRFKVVNSLLFFVKSSDECPNNPKCSGVCFLLARECMPALFLAFDEVVCSATAHTFGALHDILTGSKEAIVADAPIEEAHYKFHHCICSHDKISTPNLCALILNINLEMGTKLNPSS